MRNAALLLPLAYRASQIAQINNYKWLAGNFFNLKLCIQKQSVWPFFLHPKQHSVNSHCRFDAKELLWLLQSMKK